MEARRQLRILPAWNTIPGINYPKGEAKKQHWCTFLRSLFEKMGHPDHKRVS